MVLNAEAPIRVLFDDEDRQIAARLLGDLQGQIKRRQDEAEAAEVERDRAIVGRVAASRRAQGKLWTAEMERKMLADRAATRRASS